MKDETYAYFSVVGSGDHGRITELLGVEPTGAFTEGTPMPRNSSFHYKATKWWLASSLDRNVPLHESLDDHVGDVLSKLEAIKDKLDSLKPDYEMFIQCVAYYDGTNLGCTLSENTISRLADLGLRIDFDLYSMVEPKGQSDSA